MLTLVIFSSKFSILLLKEECAFWESYFLITTSTALSHWDIHKPNESQSKFGKAYRVSWLKSKEHPFRISALEICLGLTMSSRDADPMSTLLFRVKHFCIGFQVFFLVMVLMVLEKDWQLMLARRDLRANFDSQGVVWICKQWNCWCDNTLCKLPIC